MTVWVLLKFLHVAAVIAVFSIQIASDLYFQRVTGFRSTEAVATLGAAIRKRGFVEAVIFEARSARSSTRRKRAMLRQ